MPAGGICNPAPGRLRKPIGRHYDRTARSIAALGPERAESPFASGRFRKHGPKLSQEVKALASAAAGAPKGERASVKRKARCPARKGRAHGWMRLSALRLPAFVVGEEQQTKLGRQCVARTFLYSFAKHLCGAYNDDGSAASNSYGAFLSLKGRAAEPLA